jgi:hypothetical protein
MLRVLCHQNGLEDASALDRCQQDGKLLLCIVLSRVPDAASCDLGQIHLADFILHVGGFASQDATESATTMDTLATLHE